MQSQKGKVALITGASSGIGKELANIHAENGGDLVIVARSKEALNSLKAELEQKYSILVTVIVKDLTLPESTTELYNEIKATGITVDYLVNNAGFGGIGNFHEREAGVDINMINLNITALTALTRLYLPDFVARNSGKVLNVSSTASFMPGPRQAVYYASKAYVTSFSNAIAEELHDTAVTVTALMPGATETKFGEVSGMNNTILFNRTASARKVAENGYKGMIKGKLGVVTGIPLLMRIMIGIIPLMKRKMVLFSIRKMQEEK